MSDTIRILYVEDHKDTLNAVSLFLTRRGFEVLPATDVKTGIAIGLASEFDVLVSDVGLPDGHGGEIVQELRKSKTFPAIALSGHGLAADVEKQLAYGFDICLLKPYKPSTLIEHIEQLLPRGNRDFLNG